MGGGGRYGGRGHAVPVGPVGPATHDGEDEVPPLAVVEPPQTFAARGRVVALDSSPLPQGIRVLAAPWDAIAPLMREPGGIVRVDLFDGWVREGVAHVATVSELSEFCLPSLRSGVTYGIIPFSRRWTTEQVAVCREDAPPAELAIEPAIDVDLTLKDLCEPRRLIVGRKTEIWFLDPAGKPFGGAISGVALGRVHLRVPLRRALPPQLADAGRDDIALRICCDGYEPWDGSALLQLPHLSGRRTIRFGQSARLVPRCDSGVVLDVRHADGSVFEGNLGVIASQSTPNDTGTWQRLSVEPGVGYRLSLPPGEWAVELHPERRVSPWATFPPEFKVHVQPGMARSVVGCTLEPLVEVAVLCRESVHLSRLDLWPPADPARDWKSQVWLDHQAGRFDLLGHVAGGRTFSLPPGAYRLSWSTTDGNDGGIPIDITPQSTVCRIPIPPE